MKMVRTFIIFFSTILGVIFPKFFLIKSEDKKGSLTIYNLHSTQEEYFSKYRKIIEKINLKERFINPDNMDTFFKKGFGNESYSLLTLDDGFANNLEFAEKVLDSLNIKAIFFIIPKFINEDKNINIKYFHALYPKVNPKKIKDLKEKFIPLSKDDIIKLKKSGHTIGMHGLNHENFTDLNKNEIPIILSHGMSLFEEINVKVTHFAYPFGDRHSFNLETNKILEKYFKYIHLGIRGSNYYRRKSSTSYFLKRHPISTHSSDLIYFPLSYKEIKFFTINKISLLSNFLKLKLMK